MKPNHRIKTKALQLLGWALIISSALVILGWLQERDPDCYLEPGVFAQIRLCNDDIVDPPKEPSPWHLAGALVAMALGIASIRRSKASREEDSQLSSPPTAERHD
ncbi:MAG TPA: hypothetical protein VFF03_06165 [Rhodocyclaceae bacterium]|nr:hypothetical protein [Rhodocyclaceae bacterium]